VRRRNEETDAFQRCFRHGRSVRSLHPGCHGHRVGTHVMAYFGRAVMVTSAFWAMVFMGVVALNWAFGG
jgi:hypothetical protein